MWNHPLDYVKVMLIAYAAIWVGNRVLKAAGLSQFAATQTAQQSS